MKFVRSFAFFRLQPTARKSLCGSILRNFEICCKMCNRMYTSSLNCNDCCYSINATFKPIFCTWIIPSYRAFSLTCPGSMQIYWNKRKRLHKKRVQLPKDWFGTPTWPLFHCFGTPIWPPWRHVKTLHIKYGIDVLNWPSTKACKNGTCKQNGYNYKFDDWKSAQLHQSNHLHLHQKLVPIPLKVSGVGNDSGEKHKHLYFGVEVACNCKAQQCYRRNFY